MHAVGSREGCKGPSRLCAGGTGFFVGAALGNDRPSATLFRCDAPSKLQCPKCVDQGLPKAPYCSQECFKVGARAARCAPLCALCTRVTAPAPPASARPEQQTGSSPPRTPHPPGGVAGAQKVPQVGRGGGGRVLHAAGAVAVCDDAGVQLDGRPAAIQDRAAAAGAGAGSGGPLEGAGRAAAGLAGARRRLLPGAAAGQGPLPLAFGTSRLLSRSATRAQVPAHIVRPDYAADGTPYLEQESRQQRNGAPPPQQGPLRRRCCRAARPGPGQGPLQATATHCEWRRRSRLQTVMLQWGDATGRRAPAPAPPPP